MEGEDEEDEGDEEDDEEDDRQPDRRGQGRISENQHARELTRTGDG